MDKVENFYKICKEKLGLKIIGLLCLPPNGSAVEKYFFETLNLKILINLPYLSMGMSEDYEKAITFGATHIRVGTAIFGERLEK